MEQQRAAYAVQGVDESEPAQAGKKRKKQVYTNGEDVRTEFDPCAVRVQLQRLMMNHIE